MEILNGSTLTDSRVSISDYLEQTSNQEVMLEILEGLTARQKYISSKFFYDKSGSQLFEEITRLPEYYPTRTEKTILRKIASEIARQFKGSDIVELGSGDCSKISIILEAFSFSQRKKMRYIPVDVSRSAMMDSAGLLGEKFPELMIHGLLADFLKHLQVISGGGQKLICFFGSTLGNLSRKQATDFIINIRKMMKPGDQFLLGLDMVKDIRILENAYNDSQGITAAFNKNIIHVVNHHLGTNLLPDWFEHTSFYNPEETRIEMHLKAIKDIEVNCPHFGVKIRFRKGETIHTENSHKFTPLHMLEFSAITGLAVKNIYTDDNHWFSLLHFGA